MHGSMVSRRWYQLHGVEMAVLAGFILIIWLASTTYTYIHRVDKVVLHGSVLLIS